MVFLRVKCKRVTMVVMGVLSKQFLINNLFNFSKLIV